MREVERLAANLPDPAVGLTPQIAHEARDTGQSPTAVGVEVPSGLHVDPCRLQQLPVDVQLFLSRRPVANAHGPRAAVPRERQLGFRGAFATVEAMENA